MNSFEAQVLAWKAVEVLSRLDEEERAPESTIPRSIASAGAMRVFLGALLELISVTHPELFEDSECVSDLGKLHYHQTH